MKRLPLESSQLSLVTSRVFGDHDVYIRSALGRGAPPPNPNLTVRVRPSPVRLQTQSTFRWAHADTGCAAYHPLRIGSCALPYVYSRSSGERFPPVPRAAELGASYPSGSRENRNRIRQTAALRQKTVAFTANMSFIDKLALIVIDDRKTLVARSHGKEVFFTPGGKREPGESDEEALVREIKEELSVDIVKDTIKPYGVFQAQAFGKPEGTMVRITCYTAEYAGTLTASSEIEELRFISSAERHMTTITGQMIVDDLKAKELID
eukprot:1181213-Prorocentrum_minimum.AAC.4